MVKALRRTLKFLHTLGAAGFIGGMAALAVVLIAAPATTGQAGSIPWIGVMAEIVAWIIAPSMIVTVISGLLAIAVNPAYYDAGWVWVKAATGILILEGGVHLLGPIQEEAKRAAKVLAAVPDPAGADRLLAAEAGTLWVLMAVSAANIALAIWRPRFSKSRL